MQPGAIAITEAEDILSSKDDSAELRESLLIFPSARLDRTTCTAGKVKAVCSVIPEDRAYGR